jgi:subtilase family serine protease
MSLFHRPIRAGATAIAGAAVLAVTAMSGVFAAPGAVAATPAAGQRLTAIKGSVLPTTDTMTGLYHSRVMSVEVVLAPRHEAQLTSSLRAVYTPGSGQYQHWLAKGQFDARFAPSPAQRAAVARYLRSAGLTVTAASTPFLVRAVGSSGQVTAAFHTTLSTFTDPRGIRYFANAAPVRLPAAVASGVLGVVGLANTARLRPMIQRSDVIRPAGRAAFRHGCQTPYPSRAELYSSVLDHSFFRYGYGGGPGCSGLTPDQTNSIYGAPHAGPRAKGKGVDIAVFELSAYQKSDIRAWTRQFYGRRFAPPLRNVNVDGGPLHPHCPTGDSCPKSYNGYSGDIEVDADIENELAISPDVHRLVVYNAPNDATGETEIDEYARIANGDLADSISSSWAVCEASTTAGNAIIENELFEQMALQGQSFFGAEGDTGAFECIRTDSQVNVNVLDPPSQPWVTSVGGTSLENFNPGRSRHPRYPHSGETVWNTGALCSSNPSKGRHPGLFWCGATGAGGGGSSQFWGRPFYQHGRHITNKYTKYHNGTTHCVLAAKGAACREDPDVSAIADEYTPYAEFCTGNAHTPYSVCATIGGTPPGWFGIGGTSLSSPLWAGIAADRASFMRRRIGNMNPLLYRLYRRAPRRFFHDITGIGKKTTNNGLFPATRGYDLATGIGSPKMWQLITRGG